MSVITKKEVVNGVVFRNNEKKLTVFSDADGVYEVHQENISVMNGMTKRTKNWNELIQHVEKKVAVHDLEKDGTI